MTLHRIYSGIIALAVAMMAAMSTASCSSGLTAEEKAQRKATQAMADSITHARAVQLLDSGDFLIPAATLQFNGRNVRYTDSESTNFICSNNWKGTIQIASMSNPRPGANGLGGITVQGELKLVRRVIEKKGRGIWEYNLSSPLTSCRIIVTLPKGSMRATVNISGNFNGGNITATGDVIPFDPYKITVGRTI